MKTLKLIVGLALFAGIVFLSGCGKEDDDDPCAELGKVGGFFSDLAFPPSNDPDLGLQVAEKVDSAEAEFIIPADSIPEAYAYLNAIKNELLASQDINFKDEFAWKLTIIDKDILNAFATPGGYIYVYTGLIQYLENVDDLAGVLGHEIAHADRRHSVNQLIKNYGVQILLSIVAGNDSGKAGQIAEGLVGTAASLSFSRDDESEADAASVEYLDETDFACNGTAEFFRRLSEEGSSRVPEFLSTHPNPTNRVMDIDARAECRGCSTERTTAEINGMTYVEFQALFDWHWIFSGIDH